MTWRGYLDPNPRARHLIRLRDVLEAAYAEPRLRALLPFTSHEALGFRTTIGSSGPTLGISVVPHGDDRYRVVQHGCELGITDSAGAVALVLSAWDGASARA